MAFKKKNRGVEAVEGEKTYRLTQQHYRLGRLYEPGDTITIDPKEKGRTWVEIDGDGEDVEVSAAPEVLADTVS